MGDDEQEWRVYRRSNGGGEPKRHLIPVPTKLQWNDDGGVDSLCGHATARRGKRGDHHLNERETVPFTGFGMYPNDDWCGRCRSHFERREEHGACDAPGCERGACDSRGMCPPHLREAKANVEEAG